MEDQLPDFIAAEIVRRLPAQFLTDQERETIAGIVEISLAAAKPDNAAELSAALSPLNAQGRIYRGSLEFEIAVAALGETQKLCCRALYAMSLGNDEDQLTGEPIRIAQSSATRIQALVWNDCGTSPEWVDLDERVIPVLAMRRVDELIEAEVVATEVADNSTS